MLHADLPRDHRPDPDALLAVAGDRPFCEFWHRPYAGRCLDSVADVD